MGHGGRGGMGTWVIGAQGVWATSAMGHMGNGVQGYGQWGNGQFAPKMSKRCQVVKKMSSCQKDVKCQKIKHLDYGEGSQKK